MQQPIRSTSPRDNNAPPAFQGFAEGKHHSVPLYEAFFIELLPHIDDLNELKITLYCFWKLDQMEGVFRCIRLSDALADEDILSSSKEKDIGWIATAFQRAVRRGTLLTASITNGENEEQLFFLNSVRGRAANQAVLQGSWLPELTTTRAADIAPTRPNVFQQYEENIGPLTPIIADSLKDAEANFPAEWLAEAFQIAVENNKRSWRYINAILDRWDREGKHGRKEKPEDRQDSPESRRKYVEGEFSEFIEH